MGIKFDCVHCGHGLHVKDYLAGKRGVCPHCQGKVRIPTASTYDEADGNGGGIAVEVSVVLDEQQTREMSAGSFAEQELIIGAPADAPAGAAAAAAPDRRAAPGDVFGEAPQAGWYVLPAGTTTKYGPAPGDLMRSWIAEGRVAADSLVWREGWAEWRSAAAVFPQLAAAQAVVVSSVAAQQPVVVQQPAVQPSAVHQAAMGQQPVAASAAAQPAGDAVQAVVLGVDDVAPLRASERIVTPRKSKGVNLTRQQRNALVGILGALFVVLLGVVVYLLTQ